MAISEFSENALDHADHPRNYGELRAQNAHAWITGPCGDTMTVWLNVVDERIAEISFETDGCRSSRACGSMAMELALGKRITEAQSIDQMQILTALGGIPEAGHHCALLAAETLRAACLDWQANRTASLRTHAPAGRQHL